MGRIAVACCAAVTCIAVTGCASSAGGNAAQAARERAAVLPEAQEVFRQLLAAGVRLAPSISGEYAECGADDPLVSQPASTSGGRLRRRFQHTSNWVQYSALEQTAQGNGRPVSTAFIIKALDAASWDLQPQRGAGSYAGWHGNFDLWLDVISFEPYSSATQVLINVSGACFNAGGNAQNLTQGPKDQVQGPDPTTTPS